MEPPHLYHTPQRVLDYVDQYHRRQRKMIVAGRLITACAVILAAIVAITILSQ